jgi:hypothetical protein
MISYLTYRLIQEADVQVNTHSTHLEEKFLVDGKKGLDATIEGLQYIVDTIGRGDIPAVSTKMDGIALFFGWTSKGFMVSNKGLFNKAPKLAYNEEDMKANWKSDLHPMMKAAMQYLPKVCPKDGCVYQADFLFMPKTLKSVKIDGVPCWAWHPNIIEYTVSKTSPIGKKAGFAKIGLVVHTRYTWDGIDPKTLGVAEFGISKKNFKDSKDVFLIDTVSNLSNENGKVGFTDDEWKQANALIKQVASQESKLDWNLIKDQEFILQLLPYYNTFIRNGSVPSISERTGGYSQYVRTKMENEIAKRKTDKGKQAQIDKFSPYIDIPEKTLNAIFETMDILTAIKNMILNQLNKYALYKNFVVTRSGDYISTKDEGFVIVKTSAKGVKLVDRLEFSRNNFSKDIVSGFEKNDYA